MSEAAAADLQEYADTVRTSRPDKISLTISRALALDANRDDHNLMRAMAKVEPIKDTVVELRAIAAKLDREYLQARATKRNANKFKKWRNATLIIAHSVEEMRQEQKLP